MSHGENCDCMMCTIGKKMGMIKKDNHSHADHHDGHDHSNHSHAEHHPDNCTCEACSLKK